MKKSELKQLIKETLEKITTQSRLNEGNKIPKEWSEYIIDDTDQDEELYGGEIIKFFSAPMDGWDEEHTDTIRIIQIPEGKYKIEIYYAFGSEDEEESKKIYPTYDIALKKAIEIMEEIMDGWDDEDYV